MAIKCDKCGETFYSDEEYREHCRWETLMEYWEDLKKGQQLFSDVLWKSIFELRLSNIFKIARDEEISFQDALKKHEVYWNTLADYEKGLNK